LKGTISMRKDAIILTWILLILCYLLLTGCSADADSLINSENANQFVEPITDDELGDATIDDHVERTLADEPEDAVFIDPYDQIALHMFEELAWEMKRNGGSVSFNRVVELFGDYQEDEFGLGLLEFNLSPQVDVLAYPWRCVDGNYVLFDDEKHIVSIVIKTTPAFVFAGTIDADKELLRSYGRNLGELTYDYLCSLIGSVGTLVAYRGVFVYEWGSSEMYIYATVGADGTVESLRVLEMTVQRRHQLGLVTQEDGDEIIARIAELAHEMDANGGFVSRDRIIEVFGTNYEERITYYDFPEVSLSFRPEMGIIVSTQGCEKWMDEIHLSMEESFLENEDLEISEIALQEYIDGWRQLWRQLPEEERPTLDYFEEMFGGPGIIVGYSGWRRDRGYFIYTWVSQDYVVNIHANQYGVLHNISIRANRLNRSSD